MNTAQQLERRERELHELAGRLETKFKAVKTNAQLKTLEPELRRLEDAFQDLTREKAINTAFKSPQYAAVRGSGGNLGSEPTITTKAMTGAQLVVRA
jgi:DNA repair exonuclease SbcCD ATPase subunit